MGADKRYAVVSCHVEAPLDDRTWSLFADLQRAQPGGFRIAALMRPPDEAAGEDPERFVERAREAARHGPLGQHTHWGGPRQARPLDGDPAARVRREAAWLRAAGLAPTLFCGGGWYVDAGVAATAAELGYADCTGTSFAPPYLAPDAPRLSVPAPAQLRLAGGATLLELPTTHSIGMLARGVLRTLREPVVHAYFHDTDLLDRRRALALRGSLVVLGRRRRATDLDRLAAEPPALELEFAEVATPRT